MFLTLTKVSIVTIVTIRFLSWGMKREWKHPEKKALMRQGFNATDSMPLYTLHSFNVNSKRQPTVCLCMCAASEHWAVMASDNCWKAASRESRPFGAFSENHSALPTITMSPGGRLPLVVVVGEQVKGLLDARPGHDREDALPLPLRVPQANAHLQKCSVTLISNIILQKWISN